MKVGLCYDLRDDWLALGHSLEDVAEFDSPGTIDALCLALAALGHETDRIGNVHALMRRLVAGERWDIVWNIAEGMHGIGRESQVPCLLDAHRIGYVFSDPLVCALTLHKAMAKRVLRDLGVPTPDFAVVERLDDVERVHLPFPLFAKPLAEGTSKGIHADSRITDREQLARVCERLLATFKQPVLVERFLPGRELTVGIVGTGARAEAIAALDFVLLEGADPAVYTQRNKEECESLVRYHLGDGPLAAEAKDLALRAWVALGCRDGGRVDVRQAADGRLQVMEINPLPGLHPTHSDLPIMCTLAGIEYLELIRRIFESAVRRLEAAAPWTS
ncbi:MAG: D-alanine--D-alanine ligase [Planctomycetes bacterium]|nr:D-alanine--D-alanine ligase [Planctomycetota bacterium]